MRDVYVLSDGVGQGQSEYLLLHVCSAQDLRD